MPYFKTTIRVLGRFLARHGGWGLFLISYLDSSFLAFPFINDLLLMKFSSLHPARAWIYALECTIGSVLGAYTLYHLTRTGSRYFHRKAETEKKTRFGRWLERNDFLSILVASLLPPPMPFKIFPLIAGGLRTDGIRFILALLVGRGLRFAAESWVGVRYGALAQRYLRENIVWLSVVVIAIILVVALAVRWLEKEGEHVSENSPQE